MTSMGDDTSGGILLLALSLVYVLEIFIELSSVVVSGIIIGFAVALIGAFIDEEILEAGLSIIVGTATGTVTNVVYLALIPLVSPPFLNWCMRLAFLVIPIIGIVPIIQKLHH